MGTILSRHEWCERLEADVTYSTTGSTPFARILIPQSRDSGIDFVGGEEVFVCKRVNSLTSAFDDVAVIHLYPFDSEVIGHRRKSHFVVSCSVFWWIENRMLYGDKDC